MRDDYLATFHYCDYASVANVRSGQRPVGQMAGETSARWLRALESKRSTVYCADDRIGSRADEGPKRLLRLSVPELYELQQRLEFRVEEFWWGRGGL